MFVSFNPSKSGLLCRSQVNLEFRVHSSHVSSKLLIDKINKRIEGNYAGKELKYFRETLPVRSL